MRVRVETGRAERRAHRILNRREMQKEVEQRLKEVSPRYTLSFPDYLNHRSVRYPDLDDIPHAYGFERRMSRHPDVCLAIIDIVEALRDYAAERELKVQSVWRTAWNGKPRFTLRVRLISETPHQLASEVERIVTKIEDAYGSSLKTGWRLLSRRMLAFDVAVVQKPVYVSPRFGLKALEEKKQEEDPHAAIRSIVKRMDNLKPGRQADQVVIDQPQDKEEEAG